MILQGENMKEKLIELLRQDPCPSEAPYLCPDDCKYNKCDSWENCFAERYADYLIANGVTVQKKGEWKWEYIVTHGVAEKKAVCSLCGVPNKQYKPPYCPHCGAKMDAPKDGE